MLADLTMELLYQAVLYLEAMALTLLPHQAAVAMLAMLELGRGLNAVAGRIVVLASLVLARLLPYFGGSLNGIS